MGGDFQVEESNRLRDIGLPNLKIINGDAIISKNNALENVNGLGALRSVKGGCKFFFAVEFSLIVVASADFSKPAVT